uniref:Uncharacterized protein n=1 Tax=Anopheles merus TaxID=30066 RepID=A0A182V8U3_ANOME
MLSATVPRPVSFFDCFIRNTCALTASFRLHASRMKCVSASARERPRLSRWHVVTAAMPQADRSAGLRYSSGRKYSTEGELVLVVVVELLAPSFAAMLVLDWTGGPEVVVQAEEAAVEVPVDRVVLQLQIVVVPRHLITQHERALDVELHAKV